MAEQPPAKRPYRSSRRQAQANQTRLLIVDSARDLFTSRGYSGASIEAIAAAAGVAPETVYAAFGSKLGILKTLVHVSLTGDDSPVPLLQRPFIQSAQLEVTQPSLVRKFARDIYDIMSRIGPIFTIMHAAAPLDPEIAALLEGILRDRLGGMRFFVDLLVRIGPLKEGVPPAAAAETVWVLSSAEVFDLLTVHRGWERERYTSWLADAVTRLVLP